MIATAIFCCQCIQAFRSA